MLEIETSAKDRNLQGAALGYVDMTLKCVQCHQLLRSTHMAGEYSAPLGQSAQLPSLSIKQDAVPGMTIDVWFTPTREGEFELACAELCGLGHYQMRGFLHVVSEQEFEQWLTDHAKQAN